VASAFSTMPRRILSVPVSANLAVAIFRANDFGTQDPGCTAAGSSTDSCCPGVQLCLNS
jgi:hypothetical protein